MLLQFFKNNILLILIIFISLNNLAFQKVQKKFTIDNFNQIHSIFEQRFERFRLEKIRIKASFRDSLFSIQKWAIDNGNEKQKLTADFQVFFAYNQLIDNEKIIELGTNLLSKKAFLEFPESSYTTREILTAYHRKGYHKKQLELYPFFKKLNAKHNYNVKDKSYSDYNELAMIFYRIGDFTNARENFKLQAKNFLEKEDFFKASSMFNNIALTYEKEYDYKNAIVNYNKSLNLIKKHPQTDKVYTEAYKKHFKNVVASNIASLKMKKLDLNGLETVFLRELNSSKKLNEPRTTVQSYLNLSDYNLLTKNYKISLKHLDSSFTILNDYESPELLSRAYLLKAKYLLSQNKVLQSEFYFQKNIQINDSLKRVKIEKDFEESSLAYNLGVVKNELKDSKELLRQKTKTNLYQWILIAAVLLASCVFFFQKINIKRKNKAILKNRKQLKKALKKNENLLKEIHHRIKNNLQVIGGILELKSSKLKGKKNQEVFLETQKYIESMSFIHQHLYEQDSNGVLDMQKYLEELANAIIKNYINLNIIVSIQTTNAIMQSEKAKTLGLIVCELITNSAKYAFEKNGQIEIVLIFKENKFHLSYLDDGIGFNIDKVSKPGQIGLNLIDMLIEELNATSEKDTKNGMHLKLEFK